MAKKARHPINDIGSTQFNVLCDVPLLDGKTTALTKSQYYAWKICKM